MGDQSKMNQSAKDWCKVVVCATRWLGRVIHLIENTDNQIEIFSKQKLSSGTSWLQRLNWKWILWILNIVDWNRWIDLVKLSPAGD